MTTQQERTSVLKQISNDKCGQCGEPRGEHSSKNKTRCMYKADVSLYQAVKRIVELEDQIKILKEEGSEDKAEK